VGARAGYKGLGWRSIFLSPILHGIATFSLPPLLSMTATLFLPVNGFLEKPLTTNTLSDGPVLKQALFPFLILSLSVFF